MTAAGDVAEFDAAIVIVNYRTPELVERCLASMRETAGELRLQLVIVDNDSQDGSVERLRAALPDATIVASPRNGGFAAGVNLGFAHSSAEVVVLLNPDTEVRSLSIQSLLERLRARPEAGVVAPLLESGDGKLAPNGYRRFPTLFTSALHLCIPAVYALSYLPIPHFDAMTPSALLAGDTPAHVTGAALAIRRQAYEDAGLFDEGFFMYLEETEWQYRVTQAGWAIAIAPEARVCHLIRGGGEDSEVPSPHLITSVLRYLQLRGVPLPLSKAVLGLALLSSWWTLCLIALLPAKRTKAARQARAYRRLLRELL